MPVTGTINEQYPVITGKFKRHILKIKSYLRVPWLETEKNDVPIFYELMRHKFADDKILLPGKNGKI